VYLFTHGLPQWKRCSLHFSSVFLVILRTNFKDRKFGLILKPLSKFRSLSKVPHSFTVWFALPQTESKRKGILQVAAVGTQCVLESLLCRGSEARHPQMKASEVTITLWEAFSLNTDSCLTNPVPYCSTQSSKMQPQILENHGSLLRSVFGMRLVKLCEL